MIQNPVYSQTLHQSSYRTKRILLLSPHQQHPAFPVSRKSNKRTLYWSRSLTTETSPVPKRRFCTCASNDLGLTRSARVAAAQKENLVSISPRMQGVGNKIRVCLLTTAKITTENMEQKVKIRGCTLNKKKSAKTCPHTVSSSRLWFISSVI